MCYLTGYDENTICIGLSRVGSDSQNIVCDTLKKMKDVDLGPPLHSLVIPGHLHFIEIEMLKEFTKHFEIFERFSEQNESK